MDINIGVIIVGVFMAATFLTAFAYSHKIGTDNARTVLLTTVVILAVLVLAGCAPYGQVKVGHRFAGHELGNDIAHLSLGLERRLGDGIVGHCEWVHVSNPSRGTPFNGKHEHIWYEYANCGIKLGGLK
jgi:hypothetical protein